MKLTKAEKLKNSASCVEISGKDGTWKTVVLKISTFMSKNI